jgi:hypothetical protein
MNKETINIILKKQKSMPRAIPPKPESPFDKRSGFFGMVTAVNPKSNTVSVRMDSMREITGVRVASLQWVTIDEDKGFLTGQRNLPPVNTFVYCLMPTGETSSAIVLCSVFAYEDSMGGGIEEYKEDTEDAAFIDKKIDSGGWKFTHDIRKGTRKIKNAPKDGEETISIEVDQEKEGKEKITVTIHGNIFTVDKDNGIKIKIEGDADWSIDGNSNETVGGTKTIKAATINLN